MKLFSQILFFSSLIAASQAALGQAGVTDSLKYKINRAVSGKEKISAIVELAEYGLDADSLYPYVLMAESIADREKDKLSTNRAAYCRATYYTRKNINDSALLIADNLISYYRADQDQQRFYLTLLFFKAKILDRANQYSKVLKQLVDVIQEAETQKDTLIQIQAKTGIGWVQIEMEQYREALQWLYKAKHTSADKRFYKNYGALYSNMATAYSALGNTDSAEYYINIAIKDARENDNFTFLATALSMQANIFTESKRPHLAEGPLNEVLEIRKKLHDPFYIVFDMSNLASYYASNNQPQKGIDLCKEGIALARRRGMPSQLLMIYRALAENYKVAGKMTEYGQTLENIISLKDSFNNINSSKQIAELMANNDTQKKEKQIIEQKLNLTRKNYWLYGSILFAMMAAVIAWQSFKNYRRKQKLEMQLALEEEKRLSALAVTDAEEHERKRIAADLHDNLGVYAASLSSNLSYIQPAKDDPEMINAFGELKNNSNAIISELNDTIWALKKDALLLTAISDRIKVFISRLSRSYPGINMEVEEKIETDQFFPSSQAFHLYRVVQEAVNNSLKHSRGKNILVKICSRDTWSIVVEDNGIGLQTAGNPTGGGNGLQNMRNRSQEAGWNISWTSKQGKGTSVNILPTTN